MTFNGARLENIQQTFTHYTTDHRGTVSKTNQSYMRQKWKLNNAPLKSHSCVPEISEQMSPHLPKKTDSFLSKFSFSQHLEMEAVQDTSVGVVRNTELSSTIRTMFP